MPEPDPPRGLPPGQHAAHGWPVLHYGPLPKFRADSWDLRVFGGTASGVATSWSYEEWLGLPRTEVLADLHCVTKFSLAGNVWGGVATSTVIDLVPPAGDVTHVLVWAEYGYSANLPLSDLRRSSCLLATHHARAPLAAEHGWPVRLVVPHRYAWKGPKWVRGLEYLVGDRRGFWEERGYHNLGDPWLEQRYSYQEGPGDGPA